VPSLARSEVFKAFTDLVGKPYTFWAALLLLIRVFLSPFEKEYKAIYWSPGTLSLKQGAGGEGRHLR